MAEKERVKEAVEWYRKNKGIYRDLAANVELIIKEELIDNEIFYHSLNSRTKEINNFRRKARKAKYNCPINEITDLAGIRIITIFEKDIYKISDIIKELFKIDYENSEDKLDLLDADRMGYKSIHYIAKLTDERTNLPEFKHLRGLTFEIQIRSILQHAWAEIEHDRNYKFKGNLPQYLQRRFYSLAGMLEMADREFNFLAKKVDSYKEKVKKLTQNGKIDLEINNTSLNKYLINEFKKEIDNDILIPTFEEDLSNIIVELEKYGIKNLVELDYILPENFHAKIKTELETLTYPNLMSLIRLIMIIDDHRKYFEKVLESEFVFLNGFSATILRRYDIPIEKLSKEYKFRIEKE